MNLWKETLEIIENNGRKFDDVTLIHGKEFAITKEQFLELANVDYDNGYGGVEVAEDLVIEGKDFYMLRKTYDGSEWWEFIDLKPKHYPIERIQRLVRDEEHYWANLKDLNKGDEI